MICDVKLFFGIEYTSVILSTIALRLYRRHEILSTRGPFVNTSISTGGGEGEGVLLRLCGYRWYFIRGWSCCETIAVKLLSGRTCDTNRFLGVYETSVGSFSGGGRCIFVLFVVLFFWRTCRWRTPRGIVIERIGRSVQGIPAVRSRVGENPRRIDRRAKNLFACRRTGISSRTPPSGSCTRTEPSARRRRRRRPRRRGERRQSHARWS